MTYKRIIQINDSALAEAMADEANYFGITFRAARSGGANEYVIEGSVEKRRNIENIVAGVMAMDAQSAEVL